MKLFLVILCLLSGSLFAEHITLDPSAHSFEMKPRQKERVDTFDFAGHYPDLENIDINGRRRKNVEFYLTGEYPILESVNYEGAFGILSGELTGTFPKLTLVNFLCTHCAMKFDLDAEWKQSCEINIRGGDENIHLTLPKNVGLIIHTKTAVKGKVVASEGLKKKNRFGILKKTFENELAETADIVITLNIECADGHIFLN